MIKIGLVGEDPNDTVSIQSLLNKKYKDKVQFHTLLKRINGYQLDNPKSKRNVAFEFKESKCNFILYIRDSDGIKSESKKIQQKINWFLDIDKSANGKGVLLLNIWELEAMILADIGTFNKLYKTNIKFTKDPMMQSDPKGFLMQKTANNYKKYQESHCPEIFKELNFDIVKKKCEYFREFVSQFEEKIKNKK